MERVVVIHLNGNAFQMEEPAYEALRAYLARAEDALADNPDRAEILRDLEQAIADKCAAYLGAHKGVVLTSEMARVLQEMGPVAGEDDDSEDEAPPRARGAGAEPPRRRLYRVKDDAMIAGVCAGIGAYFDIDVNIIRLIFILGAVFTSGVGIVVYVVMMFLIPSAHTSEEWAAAHGAPFNAQEVIERAKREARAMADETARALRRERRAWRRQWRENHRDWGFTGPPMAAPPAEPAGYVTRIFAGLFAFVFSLVTAGLLIAFLIVLFSLLTTGAVLGWALPLDVPTWLAIVVVCIAYAAISAPFSALQRASYATVSGVRAGGGGEGLVTLALVALAAWIAYLYSPEARALMDQIPEALRTLQISFGGRN